MTRYELLDRIGVGGMAEIFRGKAVAAGGFEKPVAIKRILPHLCQDQRFVRLLIAEAKILSLLRQRNIVQIFDVGLGEDQQYFLVMEFVDGVDLGAIQGALEQRRRRLPLDLVLFIGAELCDALEYAHHAKAPDGTVMRLVHRDVSPSNVLLSRSGEVKLTDFGIAKRAEEVTTHGAVRGKFSYISPEQARNEPVDARSDVFSLGVLLYEMLLGRRLYSGLADLEALRAVRAAQVPRPRDVDPKLMPEVEELLLAALAREPHQRFASAGELGARLRSLRYSLDEPAGDPATELGKIVEGVADSVEQAGKKPRPRNAFQAAEPTVVRLRAFDEFSSDPKTAILKAKEIVDRFEEEETRFANLSRSQMDQLRGGEHTVERTIDRMLDGGAEDGVVERAGFGDSEATRIDENVAARLLAMDPPTVDEHDEQTHSLSLGRGGRSKDPTRPPPLPRSKEASRPPPLPGLTSAPPPNPLRAEPAPANPLAGPPPLPPPAPVLAPPASFDFSAPAGSDGPGLPASHLPELAMAPLGTLTDLPSRADPTHTARPRMESIGPGGYPLTSRPSLPVVEGFARTNDSRRTVVLVVGALLTGILGFGITRAILGGDDAGPPAVAAPADAGPGGEGSGGRSAPADAAATSAGAAPPADAAPPPAPPVDAAPAAAPPVDAAPAPAKRPPPKRPPPKKPPPKKRKGR